MPMSKWKCDVCGKRRCVCAADKKERYVIVTQRIGLHFPAGTTDEQINEYLSDAMELGHCGFVDAKPGQGGIDDERWPRL